jgi:hypothetical protein
MDWIQDSEKSNNPNKKGYMGSYYEYNCINRLIEIGNTTQAQWAKDHLNRYFGFDT